MIAFSETGDDIFNMVFYIHVIIMDVFNFGKVEEECLNKE